VAVAQALSFQAVPVIQALTSQAGYFEVVLRRRNKHTVATTRRGLFTTRRCTSTGLERVQLYCIIHLGSFVPKGPPGATVSLQLLTALSSAFSRHQRRRAARPHLVAPGKYGQRRLTSQNPRCLVVAHDVRAVAANQESGDPEVSVGVHECFRGNEVQQHHVFRVLTIL